MDTDALSNIATHIRLRTIETSAVAKVPHLASCLSCVDILVALYWDVLNIDSQQLDNPARDRFILSKGHAAPALFQVLAAKKFFHEALLDGYGCDGSLFGEHPPAHGVPGIEAATGSLGHGLPIGVGLALASRLNNMPYHTYVLLGDGECNEGSVWEAAMFSAANKLSHLTVIIDFNKWQATGRSESIMSLSPMHDKWRAFGWDVCEIDGHNFSDLVGALTNRAAQDKPKAIVAHTVKGKGISFMEDDNNWHYRTPSEEELCRAKAELDDVRKIKAMETL